MINVLGELISALASRIQARAQNLHVLNVHSGFCAPDALHFISPKTLIV